MKDSSIQFPRVIIGAIALSVFGIIAILIINSLRPSSHTERLTPEEVRATGKCISCHERQTPGITKLHLESKHFKKGVSCLDCHKGNKGQKIIDHRGFKITKNVRSGNCKACHEKQYNQYERSRHSGPA